MREHSFCTTNPPQMQGAKLRAALEAEVDLREKCLNNLIEFAEEIAWIGIQTFTPTPIEPDETSNTISLTVTRCAYCGLGFEISSLDVVVTPCLHVYHLFCASHMFWQSPACQECSCEVPASWISTMGFINRLATPVASNL